MASTFLGRTRELGALRSALDARDPSIVRVSGPFGSGKSALVRRACDGADAVHVAVPPLPAAVQRTVVGAAMDMAPGGEPPTWTAIFDALRERAGASRRRAVLVLDDAHRLTESRARWLPAADAALAQARTRGVALHIVLVGPGPALPAAHDHERVALDLALGPLDLRAAATLLPGGGPADVVRAYAVFGGMPGRLAHVDPGASLATNVRRTLLEPGAPLARWGVEMLERAVQTPARYAALLRTLGRGETDWATLHAGVPDLTRSGQAAPYIRRLEELGLVEVRRSLDASPGGRSRRYRLRDPFDAFWFRFLLDHGPAVDAGEGEGIWAAVVRPALDRHVATVLPELCRQYMAHDVMERVAGNAREVGSLWGAGYDLPVAGVLRTGPAFYGRAFWTDAPAPGDLDDLDRQMRETRYGFGREVRLRVLFSGTGFSAEVERAAARRHDTLLVDVAELVGADTPP